MVSVLMHGCGGKMGRMVAQMIEECAKDGKEVCLAAGVDSYLPADLPFPGFKSLEEVDIPCDVIIDFSNASATDHLLDFAAEKNIPVVLCTTGLSDEQLAKVKATSEKVAVLRSANMTLGVNLLMKLLKEAVAVLSPAGFDVEIVEKHHNKKVDAPSGTALALADAMNEEMDESFIYVYDRSQKREARGQKELGISAVRGGTIVGDHDVIFAGPDEVITLSHRAYSRTVFAKGAVEAALYLAGKGPGLYDMSDVIDA